MTPTVVAGASMVADEHPATKRTYAISETELPSRRLAALAGAAVMAHGRLDPITRPNVEGVSIHCLREVRRTSC
jgi:hypothetical protein